MRLLPVIENIDAMKLLTSLAGNAVYGKPRVQSHWCRDICIVIRNRILANSAVNEDLIQIRITITGNAKWHHLDRIGV